jgi:hypothetical protein
VAEARGPAWPAAKPRHWTTQQLHDVHSMYHFIGHMERDATALGLRDVAKILAMAALALEDELAVTQPAVTQPNATQPIVLSLVES